MNPIKPFDIKGNNLPGNIPLTGWAALMEKQTLGKRVVIRVGDTGEGQKLPSPVNILSIQNADQFAIQLNVTLSPPRFIFDSPALANIGNVQDATGEAGNTDLIVGAFVRSFAIIEWGIGGVSEKAEVDFSNGLCINLNASFVRITAALIKDAGEIISPGAYVFSAFIGPGFTKARNAQKTIHATRNGGTDQFFNAAPQLSDMFAVPVYSKAVTLCGIQIPGGGDPGANNQFSGTIQFFRGNPVAPFGLNMLCEYFFNESSHEPVNVPNGAYYFLVKNLTPTAPAAGANTIINVIFDLAI
jgi:hypothetical protein